MMGVAFVAGLAALMVHIAVQLTKEQRAVLRAARQKKQQHTRHH